MHIPWDIIVTIIAATVGSGGFWAFMQYMTQKRDKEKNALEEGVLALLHDRIYAQAQEYIMDGKVSFSEYDNLEYLYRPYNALGGNGVCKTLFEQVSDLPKVDSR